MLHSSTYFCLCAIHDTVLTVFYSLSPIFSPRRRAIEFICAFCSCMRETAFRERIISLARCCAQSRSRNPKNMMKTDTSNDMVTQRTAETAIKAHSCRRKVPSLRCFFNALLHFGFFPLNFWNTQKRIEQVVSILMWTDKTWRIVQNCVKIKI